MVKQTNKNNKKTKSSQVKGKTSSAAVPVVERREFYKDAKRSLVALAIFSTINLAASSYMVYSAHQANIENIFFSIKDDGTMIEMIPFSEPNLKDSIVVGWVQKALMDTFDFNFTNMNASLSESSMKWFTNSGGSELIKALQDEGHFDMVLNRKLILMYTPDTSPIIIKKELNRNTGKYNWYVVSEGVLKYTNEKGKQYSRRIKFSVLVERVSLRQDPQGVGIAKIIMTNSEK